MCVCVVCVLCVCVSACVCVYPEAINNYWRDFDRMNNFCSYFVTFAVDIINRHGPSNKMCSQRRLRQCCISTV